MSFLESLRQAPLSAIAQWGLFVIEYQPGGKSIFLFHEGRTDPAFYRGFVEQAKPEDYQVRLVRCGTKREVLERIEDFRSRYEENPRALFFVDKDHDDLVGNETDIGYSFLYTTCAYSIENYVCCQTVLSSYLIDVIGLPDMDSRIPAIVAQYEANKAALYRAGLPAMAWIVAARELFSTVHLNNINNTKLFDLTDDLEPKLRGGRAAAVAYLTRTTGGNDHQQDVPHDRLESIISRLEGLEPQTWFRGKQDLWYLVKFINGVAEILRNTNGGPKSKVTLSENNALEILGPRVPCPSCLGGFLDRTLGRLSANNSSATLAATAPD
jgi:hypothetical protein